MREERKPRERYEGDFRGNKVEQEGKQEMNGVLIELSKKGVSLYFFFVLHSCKKILQGPRVLCNY